MSPIRNHHPRNHAQHNTKHPRYIESSYQAENPQQWAESKNIFSFTHPWSTSDGTANTHIYYNVFVYASAPEHPYYPRSEAAMRIPAPEGVESSSSLSTLLSEPSPHRPITQNNTSGRARDRKFRRTALKRSKSAEMAIRDSSWKPESPPVTPLPLPTPRVNILPPTPETYRDPTVPSKAPQVGIEPPTPEVRQSLPVLGAIPQANIRPPTSGLAMSPKQPPCSPVRHSSEQCSPKFLQSPGKLLQVHTSQTSEKEPQTRPPHSASKPLQTQGAISYQRSPHHLMGTFKGPPYQPFARPNQTVGERRRMQRTASFIDLRDCWRCPEAELTAKTLRRWSSGAYPIKRMRRKQSPWAQEGILTQDWTDLSTSAHENTPLLATIQPTPSENLENTLDAALSTKSVSETEVEAPAYHIGRLFSTIFFPFTAIYTYISTTAKAYIHDHDAHSGQLGSHDTETARWLRRSEEECFETRDLQRTYGSFSPPSHSPLVSHSRKGSWGSVTTISHGRDGSRGSIAREQEVRGVFGAVQWGDGIGEEYDPC